MDAKNETEFDSLREEMAQLRADLAKLAETLSAIASERADATYERVRDATQKAAAQASSAADSVGHEISARPFTSISTAFIIGAMVGMLFSRRP